MARLFTLSSVRRGHSFIWSDPILEDKLPAGQKGAELISRGAKDLVSEIPIAAFGKWQI